MVREGGGDLEVNKGVTTDGEVTTDTTDAPEGWSGGDGGRATTVAVPGWRRCDIWCACTKGYMRCIKWVLRWDISFLNSLQEKASSGERVGYIGHHQQPALHGKSSWVVIMILISQRRGKLRRDSTQNQKPLGQVQPKSLKQGSG